MSIQPKATGTDSRVHYFAWCVDPQDTTRYRGYALRKPGESDLEAALRSTRRRLAIHAFEIGTASALGDDTYSFRIFLRLTKYVREDFGEGRLELRSMQTL